MEVSFQPRFTEADAVRAYDEWGANCGPGALAAVAHLTLDELRPHLGDFESKRYTNPSMMFHAMERLGLSWRNVRPLDWPTWGLVGIQWEGPWTQPGAHPKARYRYRHWVAAARSGDEVGVFDINCMGNGTGWVSLAEWSNALVPWLIERAVKRGNGRWHLTDALEVKRAE